jgi:hypothetical protein
MGSNCLLCVSGNFANDEVIPFIEKQFQAKLINQKYSPNLFHNNIIDEPKVTHILTLQPSINRHIHLKKNINRTNKWSLLLVQYALFYKVKSN